ncbi:MAG: MBL fold metallo-hydrolase [Ginsengibacter sp.]
MTKQPLKITFLGTGTSSGVPMIGCHCEVCNSADSRDKRLRSSILVQSETTTLVVDTTPDFRTQMLRENVDKLDAVVFTHPHKDHIAGLDDIKAYNFFLQKPMEVYANELTSGALRNEFAYIFASHKYPGIPDINLNIMDGSPFYIGDIEVTPILVYHLKMPVYGFRFNDFTYITDANRIDDEELQKIASSKIITLNALRKEAHISHYTLNQAIEVVEGLKTPLSYFTHISHQLGKHEAVESKLPKGRYLAYDGLTFNV